MVKLQAKKIAEALKKAQRVGEVEEEFTVSNCSIVLRSLRNDEYEAVTAATSELSDIAFIIAFKVEHLCRSIVEINGESLREVDFVEVDVENGQTGRQETVTLERHQFIKDYVLSSWSREAVDVSFRKFNDIVAKAESAASEGVVFEVPEESPSEKYRRLLLEAKDIEGEVPFELAAKTRDEFGYLLKTEWEGVGEKLSGLTPEERVEEASSRRLTPPAPVATKPSVESILRVPPLEKAPLPEIPPPALEQPLIPPMGQPVPVASLDALRELERAPTDPSGLGLSPQTAYDPRAHASLPPETGGPAPQRRNPEQARAILDQPPAGGINPRFKAPLKL